jgi:hypothetical protein
MSIKKITLIFPKSIYPARLYLIISAAKRAFSHDCAYSKKHLSRKARFEDPKYLNNIGSKHGKGRMML